MTPTYSIEDVIEHGLVKQLVDVEELCDEEVSIVENNYILEDGVADFEGLGFHNVYILSSYSQSQQTFIFVKWGLIYNRSSIITWCKTGPYLIYIHIHMHIYSFLSWLKFGLVFVGLFRYGSHPWVSFLNIMVILIYIYTWPLLTYLVHFKVTISRLSYHIVVIS